MFFHFTFVMTSHFNPTDTLIKTFCGHLKDAYVATFGGSNPDIGEMILWAGSMALVQSSPKPSFTI